MGNVFKNCEEHCSGCGICESACPIDAIKVSEKNGFLRPTVTDNECISCDRCTAVCPSLNMEKTVSKYADFKHKLYGHSNTISLRLEASSGGITTELLIYLLDKGIVDYVVTTGCYQYDRNLEYIIIRKENIYDLTRVSGSNYCPANIGKAIAEIKALPGKCAIVCLPCLAHGIRLFQKKDKDLQQKIKYVISLLCNHVPNYEATDYLISKYNIHNIGLIKYRGNGWFGNFRVYNRSENGTEIFSVPFSEYFVTKFSKYFWQRACIKCNDHFGREADICMGDADFVKYRGGKENIGETMCFIGNKEVLDMLKQMEMENLIEIHEDIEEAELELIYGPLESCNRACDKNLKLDYRNAIMKEKIEDVAKKIINIMVKIKIRMFEANH